MASLLFGRATTAVRSAVLTTTGARTPFLKTASLVAIFQTHKQPSSITQRTGFASKPQRIGRDPDAVMSNDHILTLSCPDKPGIVHNVTGVLAKQGMNILDLQQYSDPGSERFFMRVHFGHAETTDALTEPFGALAKELQMDYTIRPKAEKPKVLIMVSKIGHCLNDLLFRTQNKQLGIEIPVIVSNHPDYRALAEGYGIEFHHLPVNKDTKVQQETQILELIEKHDVELVVLARYMQVLSPKLCEVMSGKIINIHHSFLPSFKGAKPYRTPPILSPHRSC